ncbi:hypothetical protein PTTG_06536 [Puccinia triticina 1-1 BBBD Race 1]|uniref:Secreted protein n=1 Tax=Puccinia triticina (isolate 1-1 / race 1 (BBBD)) TaxID=630390 RepID=A0A0C4F0C0_PUCT1|nr:hypothetical protein PTTG_06536 [Puccinia triticina 1-1 BBBD Race 1]
MKFTFGFLSIVATILSTPEVTAVPTFGFGNGGDAVDTTAVMVEVTEQGTVKLMVFGLGLGAGIGIGI